MINVVKKEYEVVWETPINVESIERQPKEMFVAEETKELKTLVFHGYLQVIRKTVED